MAISRTAALIGLNVFVISAIAKAVTCACRDRKMSVSSVVELTLDELKGLLARDEAVVVDVREPHEFEAGHIPGAVLMPLSQFDPASLPTEAGKTIVFSCRTGVRSLRAIELARLAGVDLDTHYRGGFQEWVQGGESVETGSS